MESKQDLIENKNHYEKLLLSALEVYHRLPHHLKDLYDEMINEYIEELKKLNKIIHERIA